MRPVRRLRSSLTLCSVTVLLVAAIAARANGSQGADAAPKGTAKTAAAPVVLPAGAERDLVTKECSRCHALGDVTRHHENEAAWKKYVDDMVVRGAKLTPVEAPRVVQYLFKNFGPPPTPPQPAVAAVEPAAPASVQPAAESPLAAGEGRDVLTEKCTVCHDLERIPARYRDKLGWEDVVDNMKARGAEITPEERQKIVAYLFAHYGIPD